MRKSKIQSASLVLLIALLIGIYPISGFAIQGSGSAIVINGLTTEYMTNPLGIDAAHPRLSWMMESSEFNQLQSAYQIEVATSEDKLNKDQADVWDTGKVQSDQSDNISFNGGILQSQKRYYWKVRVWDKGGQVTSWSPMAWWEMGILDKSGWKAQWISDNRQNSKGNPTSPSPYIRNEFIVGKEIKEARLYSSALGLYEPYINGVRVGKDLFAPGWTDYNKRIQYQTYDVTSLLKQGNNAIGAILGDGWYSGHVASLPKGSYGAQPYLLMQLEITYTDNTKDIIATDKSWKSSFGPIISQDLIMGETYDARLEETGWNQPGFQALNWSGVQVKPASGVTGQLVAESSPPIQAMEEIKPVKLTNPKQGVYIFDLGQNMVGNVRLQIKGDPGQKITIRHGEVLNPDGTLYTANLRTALATDQYILKGSKDGETYEPHFTYHGFRFVELTGLTSAPDLNTITGVVIHNAMENTGQFETSNNMVNQLQRNITWGEKGNFFSIPTDTPARDERLGWTGDINIFANTAAFNMNVAKFLGDKWLSDLRDAQTADGDFPDVAPDILWWQGGAPGWGDAGITVPYSIWTHYGDIQVIKENYPSMKAWINYLQANSKGLLRPAVGYGDWLNINDDTPKDLIATAYFAYSTRLLSEMASAIGYSDDAKHYGELEKNIKNAFNSAYISSDGRIKGDSQTAYVLALSMDLVPDAKKQLAADRLVALIKNRNWHLSTGFLGTRDLLPVLTQTGHGDIAYQLLLNDTYPSWGYQIKNGATTTWERWDSIKPDGTFSDPSMNSFNHYAYGAVGDWMYQNIAGIQSDSAQPGFKHIIVSPKLGGGLTYAKGDYKSGYGIISSDWRLEGKAFSLQVTIPVNTSATVYVPAKDSSSVKVENQAPVQFLNMDKGYAVYKIGSGTYTFDSQLVTGWQMKNGKKVYFDPTTYEMKTGWMDLGNNRYYFNDAGELVSGWLLYNQNWYYFNNNGTMTRGWIFYNKKWYYLNDNGMMQTGWTFSNGAWYFLNNLGEMQAGWLKWGNNWYFLDLNGSMVKGWKYVNGKYYYFNSTGTMALGWIKYGGSWYYLQSNGSMITGNAKILGKNYFFNAAGKLLNE